MTLHPADNVPRVVSTIVAQSDPSTIGAYLPLAHAAFVRVMNPIRPAGWRDTGSVDPDTAHALARILRAHTTTPTECSFLVWEGYAGIRDHLLPAARVKLNPDRSMLVLFGDANDGAESVAELPLIRTPQWWLPNDGAWAVGNDIYGSSVYVAGTEEAITAILEADGLEAHRATSSMAIVAEEL